MVFSSTVKDIARLCAVVAGLVAGAANAGTITYDFGNPSGNLHSSTHTYTDLASGLSIVATGYDAHGNATNLYGKNNSGDEIGLGLVNDPTGDHEIHYGSGFIQLDVSDLIGKVKSASTDFATNSTTNLEEWGIFGSDTPGSYGGPPLATGTVETAQLLPSLGAYTYYDFVELSNPSGQGDNFLIHDLTTATVPEPATWVMMLIGVFGLGAIMRGARGRRATAA